MARRALTDTEIASLRKALDDARAGRATLTQLAQAHDLAEDAGATHVVGELRSHIRRMTPTPASPLSSNIGKSLALGIVSGVLTHQIMQG
jgi:hypothetical protein